ncbi:MAG: hypothetical protein QM765_31310 [Myxococcales bacterium]
MRALKGLLFSLTAVLVLSCGGTPGKDGVNGSNGSNGTDGSNGTNGTNGTDGTNGADGLSSLVNLVTSPPSATCPYGGVKIQTGLDDNGDGTLQSSEVNSTKEVCNGAAANQLVSETTIPPGSTCLYGGTRIDIGIDDGAGTGGIAGDGVLQAGEVKSTRNDCNDQAQPIDSDTMPPLSTAGTAVVDASGGDVTSMLDKWGGPGGNIKIEITSGTLGGHLKIFGTGDATGLTALGNLPSPAQNLGSHSVHVTANTTVQANTWAYAKSHTGLFTITDQRPVGAVYDSDGTRIYQVTSFVIDEEISLTFAANQGTDAVVSIPGDVLNNGTLKTSGDTNLRLGCSSFQNGDKAMVSMPGLALAIGTSYDLVNQGVLTTTSTGKVGSITLSSAFGSIYNADTIITTGYASAQAGGNISLTAALAIYNTSTAKIDASGFSTYGTVNGNGGTGGEVTLTVSGGEENDGTSLAGKGQPIIRNGGRILAFGGTCKLSGCVGGKGGKIHLLAHGGPAEQGFVAIASSGSIDAAGGYGFGGGSTWDQVVGGAGGFIEIISDSRGAATTLGNVINAAGSIALSGDILTRGGDGDGAGAGGDINITLNPGVPLGQEIVLKGYARLSTSGGNCLVGATALNSSNQGLGSAGNIRLVNAGAAGAGSTGGGVINYAELLATGGSNYAHYCGDGGDVMLSAGGNQYAAQVGQAEVVLNHGEIRAAGGGTAAAGAMAGRAGHFTLVGAAGVKNHGALSANGGDGNYTELSTSLPMCVLSSGAGPVTNDSAIVTDGGDVGASNCNSGCNAGFAASVMLVGTQVTNSGAISAKGGGSKSAVGGAGGSVILNSTASATQNTGALSVAGGTSSILSAASTPGVVVIDGVNVP